MLAQLLPRLLERRRRQDRQVRLGDGAEEELHLLPKLERREAELTPQLGGEGRVGEDGTEPGAPAGDEQRLLVDCQIRDRGDGY